MSEIKASPEDFRYRAIPADGRRLLSLAFWQAVILMGLQIPIYLLVLFGSGIVGGMVGLDRLGWALIVVGFLLELGAIMISFWIIIRWGRFSGASLKFVREHLRDRAGV